MKRRKTLRALLFAAGFFIPACTQTENSPQNQASKNQGQVSAAQKSSSVELTLVSYGVARTLFSKMIPAFQAEWKAKTGQDVTFKESYGPSGAQTRAILGGLQADIAAQNVQTNIDALVEKSFVSPDWRQRLPNEASPANTVMVLITRPNNPKNIQTWNDLTNNNVAIVGINPQTGGNARWGILAGYGSVLKSQGEEAAANYLNSFVKNTKTLVSSGREASDAFIKNKIGDVLLTFENEIIFTNNAIAEDFPYVVPPINIQVDFPVTVVDKIVDSKGTREVAEAFTKFLFSPKGQEIYAEQGYRPIDQNVYQKYASQHKLVSKLYKIADFGDWKAVDQKLFADGALFDSAQAARTK
ncbi:sulfate ABC transporter substrate-binding protein [Nostocaceae cyanobacterium CENA357]|uniref:Sulfate ABC transporter substrate-binding protein n=1 Tax=Atlanticothrix silvestris CENA357 TaxID=1725252 RepID=A0A8J7L2A9_9CYAN|nr:sulfate ABC transporter substrate-binding protein [Atlanticothrix silvestris]MBH8551597.1 sulfate ABC transporter substrate-binding protein [Atlanticothrix silvestris CENA357]